MSVRSVFILGAGASQAAGAPLLSNFIKESDKIRLKSIKKRHWASEDYRLVHDARVKLVKAYANSVIDVDNIEDLFSTLEMASLLGSLGDMPLDKIESLSRSLKSVIIHTLENTIRYVISRDLPFVCPPYPYGPFCELLTRIHDDPILGPVAVISFNYDLCLEYALALKQIKYNYFLDKSFRHENGIIFLKLHGSLNWSQEQSQGLLSSSPVYPISTYQIAHRLGISNPGAQPIGIMDLLTRFDAWGNEPVPEPLIVPPTWSKQRYHYLLVDVWREASRVLRAVDNVFVIGYSAPPSDYFFKSFFALSTMSDTLLQRFWIFDPDGKRVKERFETLLGPAVKSRQGVLRHFDMVFDDAIQELSREFAPDGLASIRRGIFSEREILQK